MLSLSIAARAITSQPVFLNWKSEPVQPVRFALVYWDGPGDTLYAFEDVAAFDRQCATAERHGVHVHVMSDAEAADWIRNGGKAALYETSAGGVVAFGNLKLVPA